jgi:signal transduction histidine kinase
MAGSIMFGAHVDNSVYDAMYRLSRPATWNPQAALLVIDERSLDFIPHGRDGLRRPLAEALRLIAGAKPATVVVDVILSNRTDLAIDAELAGAFRDTPNLVTSSQLLSDGFVYPLAEFKDSATAVGHVHSLQNMDGVTRAIPLQQRYQHDRLWAISLEAFALSRHTRPVEYTNDRAIDVGGMHIPSVGDDRLMRIRFFPPGMKVPQLSLKELMEEPARAREFAGKAVFVGVTAQTEHDRLFTPDGTETSGIEINAAAFETMAQGMFLTDLSGWWVALLSAVLVAGAGLAFRYLPGWMAVASCALIVIAGMVTPYVFFTHHRVIPFSATASAGWLGSLTAVAYYYLVVRRNLGQTEAERARYQQAMHFVTHEMRTPLSAIQGSSELISRYALNDDKRKQLSALINSESKRLARMVEIFLNVERLSAGQMELKREPIQVKELIETCIARIAPLAERKHISVTLEPVPEDARISGDRELVEYACYNLLTNAVKYSPQQTEVRVSGVQDGRHVRIAVRDQGIGMDQKEVRQIFRKFYRTRKAEESGEVGTGIGLSIVQQIVEQHGGRIDVTSKPGAGSCFTLVLSAAVDVPAPAAAERR